MRRLDLRGRLTLASVVVLGLGLAVVSLSLLFLLSDRLSADASSVLRDRAAARLATLEIEHGNLRPAEHLSGDVLEEAAWVFQGTRAVQTSPASPHVREAVTDMVGVRRPTERNVAEKIRLLATPAYGRGALRHQRLGTVVVGLSLAPYERTKHLALFGTVVLALFSLLGAALLTRRVVGAALRPVADMTDRAADWSEQDLHRRFALGPPRDELTGLAATLDALLDRLEAGLRHEQRLSAEIAHELRTPLTGMRMEAELALRDHQDDEDRREALERVLAGTERMATVIDTLLATAHGHRGAPGACDPAGPVAEVAGTVRAAAGAHGILVEVEAEPGAATALSDPDVLAQAIHPLLENAVRHAATRVTVRVEPGDGAVVVAVQDDGPGVAPGDADRIFDAGTSGAGGAGLGLPLARRLARASGGDVRLVPSETGARFELRVPGGATRVRSGSVQALLAER